MRHLIVAALLLAAVASINGQARARPKVLVLADTHTGNTHEALGHAMATIDRLGHESKLWDTYIRTDSQWVNKQPISKADRSRREKNLDDFAVVVLMSNANPGWTAQQKADFISFVKDDGKGVVGAHTGNAAFYDWPEFGEMMGGFFDKHPWGKDAGEGKVFEGRVVVEAPDFPAMRHFPRVFTKIDEYYVLRDEPYSRDIVRVLAHLDVSNLDLSNPDYHRTDGDVPVALARTYGKGRTFWSTFGHTFESWDDPDIQKMYLEAIKWAMGRVPGDAAPRPGSGPGPGGARSAR